jgi:hypothetical protein
VRRLQRQQQRGQTECGLRVAHGEHAGLRPRWTHGVARLEPGTLTFTPFVGGARIFRRRPISISVHRVDRQRQATVAMREALTTRPGLTVIQIVTSTGAVLDWLLH